MNEELKPSFTVVEIATAILVWSVLDIGYCCLYGSTFNFWETAGRCIIFTVGFACVKYWWKNE